MTSFANNSGAKASTNSISGAKTTLRTSWPGLKTTRSFLRSSAFPFLRGGAPELIEIKFGINNKNKMLKLIGSDAFGEGSMSAKGSFLLRDIKDQHYPYAGEYADFDKHRRWEEHEAVQLDVTGAVFRAREWYAYVDAQKKEWDFTKTVDLSPRRHDLDDLNARRGQDAGKKIEHFWRHLPFRCQAKFTVYGLVKYEDMLIIDDKGRSLSLPCPTSSSTSATLEVLFQAGSAACFRAVRSR